MCMLLHLKGILFQISHGFLMLPLQFGDLFCIGNLGFPDPGHSDDFQFVGGGQMDSLCLPYGGPVGSLGICYCSGIPGLCFSDSLRSVNFILAMTDFCF